MAPIICEECYEFLDNPHAYFSHKKMEHSDEEE